MRKDVRTVEFNVPQLKSPECMGYILEVLNTNKVEGVKGVTPAIDQHKLLVTYDSTKLGIKNIEFLIASAGFDANNTAAPADVKSKLPPDCQ
ncbi:MAG TPA: hypothetical protein VIH35_05455 [Kiritimatiellia bacterium]|jgi:glycine/serine hydroxymethyltransferase